MSFATNVCSVGHWYKRLSEADFKNYYLFFYSCSYFSIFGTMYNRETNRHIDGRMDEWMDG